MNSPTIAPLVASVVACEHRLAAAEQRRRQTLLRLDAEVQAASDAVCRAAAALAAAHSAESVIPRYIDTAPARRISAGAV